MFQVLFQLFFFLIINIIIIINININISIEYKECGNHGVCDYKTGSCICQRGFHGDACHDTSDGLVILLFYYHLLSFLIYLFID